MTKLHLSKEVIGIITASLAVIMLLLLFTTRTEEKDAVEVEYDPETTYTMFTTEVNSLISDSGITRYRLIAQEWYIFGKAEEPYWYFPEGIYVENFDSLFVAEATIKADTAYHWEKKQLWRGVGNVEVKNLKGEFFETSELFWDRKEEKMYSDKFIRIVREDETVITGIGFESNQDMSNYRIYRSAGEFPMNESSPSDSTRTDSTVVRVNPATVPSRMPTPTTPRRRVVEPDSVLIDPENISVLTEDDDRGEDESEEEPDISEPEPIEPE